MDVKALLIIVCAIATLGLGCSGQPGPEDNSGDDQVRAGAQRVPFEVAVTDAINFEGGDATDWKVFEVTRPGRHTLDFYFDDEIIAATIYLHDQYGAQLRNMRHNTAGNHDRLTVDLAEAGLYYVRITTSQYRTTYSVRFQEGEPTEEDRPVVEEDPRPEFDRPI